MIRSNVVLPDPLIPSICRLSPGCNIAYISENNSRSALVQLTLITSNLVFMASIFERRNIYRILLSVGIHLIYRHHA